MGAGVNSPESALPRRSRCGGGTWAYVLSEADGSTPDLILIATGSEVSLVLDAKKILVQRGVRTRVVSMPCWELFDAQPQEYRDAVLPPAIGARMSVEAGATLGWSKYVGDRGFAFGIDHFGASAPAADIARDFGFTAENVAKLALDHLPSPSIRRDDEEPDQQLLDAGQSVWLDNLRRSMFASGELRRLIDQGLRGMTSNPTIFEKAIGAGNDYDEQLAGLIHSEKSADSLFWDLAVADIQNACDAFRASTTRRAATTASSASRFRRCSPTTRRARSRWWRSSGAAWAGAT